MNIRQLFYILRLRWWLVLGIVTISVTGTYLVSKQLPKVYIAETSLLLDVKSDPLLSTFMPAIAGAAYIGTQMEIIRSDRVASQVVQMLGVDRHADSLDTWRSETGGKVPVERYFGELLLRSLGVQVARNSNVITISYASADPKFAAAAANAFAQAYLSTNSNLRVEPAKQYAGYYEGQIKSIRENLEKAQARLSDFQSKHGIVASPERVDAEMARLDALNMQLASAIAEQTDTSARQQNSGNETSPDIQNSSAVQGLKAQLASAEAKLGEISSIVGSRHPQRVQLEAQIDTLKQQLTAEMRRVSGTTATVNRQSGQKVAQLRSLVEQQKRTVLGMRTQLDDLNNLQREVDAAQKAFVAVSDRRTQLTLESQSEQAGGRVLSAAIEPLVHSRPNIPGNVLIALALGTGLAVAVALGLELFDRRLRAATDLADIEGVPLLGVISPMAKPGKQHLTSIALMRPRAQMPPRLTVNGESS